MIEIHGDYGEGGGQILRSSLALAALTGKGVRINAIRSRRRQPGLRAQHLAAVKAIAELCQADLEGGFLHSDHVRLIPSQVRSGRFQFNIPTAGALSLVLQTIYFPLSLAPGRSEITLTGGTHVPWSPCFHYLTEQWLPWMGNLGFRSQVNLHQAGFYPSGGGKISVNLLPAKALTPLESVERGELLHIRGISGVSNLDDSIAQRQKHQALKQLYPLCRDTKIRTLRMPSPGKGTFVLLKADFTKGASACYTALGAPGKPAEQVTDEAVQKIISFLDTHTCLDHYLADQLLLPLSLVNGVSRFTTNCITQHLLTNAHVIMQFLPVNIDISGDLGQPGLITVSGFDIKSYFLDNNNINNEI